jgi:hypothetical protein
MNTQTEISALSRLEFLPYLNDRGLIAESSQSKIGVYAIFDRDKILQFVGYSRDIYLSLRQHLVRQSDACYWLKLQTIERPNRTILEEIRKAWIAENGSLPVGNSTDEAKWTQPIDIRSNMTAQEREEYKASDELGQMKLLKKVARRVEAQIQEQLKNRSAEEEIRFNPKLKEQGLLDLK